MLKAPGWSTSSATSTTTTSPSFGQLTVCVCVCVCVCLCVCVCVCVFVCVRVLTSPCMSELTWHASQGTNSGTASTASSSSSSSAKWQRSDSSPIYSPATTTPSSSHSTPLSGESRGYDSDAREGDIFTASTAAGGAPAVASVTSAGGKAHWAYPYPYPYPVSPIHRKGVRRLCAAGVGAGAGAAGAGAQCSARDGARAGGER